MIRTARRLRAVTKPKRRPLVAACVLAASAAGVAMVSTNVTAVQLTGSQFEIDDNANLILSADNAGTQDWATIAQGTQQGQERRKADVPSGQEDDSFGNGTKEDTAVPSVIDGSIPNHKSDLLTFGGYLETTNGRHFLNIYWHRVQEPTGTTNMDFEFNKSTVLSANGVTPVRSAGDALIQYDLSQGGVNPTLWLSRWVTSGAGSLCEANGANPPCWGERVNLTTAGLATGSINTSEIPVNESDGLATDIDGDGTDDPISVRTFGEAQIDFDALAGGTGECVAFGSAYLKSRSSDSFTAALKDFIAPLATNFSLCGSVHVIKHDDATPPALLAGAQFDLRKDNAPVGTAPGVEDTTVASCTTVAGVCDFLAVPQGQYWVVETVAPTGHDLANPAFQAVTVTGDTQTSVTFVDPRQRGAILLTKTRKHAAATGGTGPHASVSFTIAGQAVVTDSNGQACVDGLLFGSYNVVETVPAGYVADGATTKSVTVNNKATCAGTPYAGETVAFGNTPLTNVTISATSQVTGGTKTSISCDDGSGVAFTENPTLTINNNTPKTLVCTIVIDP